MTTGKIVLLTVGVVGVVALGVVVGPRLVNHDEPTVVASAPETTEAPAPVEVAKTRPITPALPADSTKAARIAARESARTIAPVAVPAVAASKPELVDRLKPVLNHGAQMEVAANGFKSGEQFAAVAHASRNTEIPFMLLKHRVLDERKSLADAIRDSRPDLNVAHEASRAHDAARFDIAAITN
jgi:hypothetical protein